VIIGHGRAKMQSTSAHSADVPSLTKSIPWIWPALLCWALLGFAQPARSADAMANLANYVQAIGTGQPQAARVQTVSLQDAQDPHLQFGNETFAALRAYAQRIGADRPTVSAPQPTVSAPQLQVAEAGSLLEFLQQRGAEQPSSKSGATPKPPKAAAPRGERPVIDATYVDGKVCLTCHASHAAAFEKTLMGKIGKTKKGMFECQNCHGPGSAHVKAGGGRGVGGIISFRPEDTSRTAEENNAVCLGCHQKGDRTMWHGSPHDERGLQCSNCHTVMKNVSRKAQLKTESQPETCFQCHKNKRAEMFRSSHIPVREGKVVCTNCHNPHGSYSEALLKQATVNDTCYQCHAEKRGPFLWEHPPVAENCLNCHDPHGSNNDFLLKISRPRLCQQCHSGGQHNSNPRNPAVALYAQGRECQNCHSNHHGSNNPSGARFMR
jgi:DmsE family decaheme c-type cytochrome